MRRITLNELTTWSTWPTRLLGLERWRVTKRDLNKVREEYDHDKYWKCLQHYIERYCKLSPEQIVSFQLGTEMNKEICVSRASELYVTTIGEEVDAFSRLLAETIEKDIRSCNTIVELGCGYGYNLWKLWQHYPDKRYVGGEYSNNAVELASHLYNDIDSIHVVPFNYYEDDYEILENLCAPILLFTSHSIEQLPSSEPFFSALCKRASAIRSIYNFEPLYERYDSTLIGLMRKKYTQLNDYNRDLVSQLESQMDKCRLISIDEHVMGGNPLNPTSILQWEYRD